MTMHPARGGEEWTERGRQMALHPFSPVSVSVVSPSPGGLGSGKRYSEVERGL